ncbi:hypothetical protein OG946_20230 [Streptomyces sp. NBC_01808]|uniref:hypothetical protein n=1 Tax=Streptomyces sp. NBC_01808 TaxID=2975947 RepID=UPI002DDA4B11|nr:hypothetical protein [Streptomyces sp. NBC_01808]WSA39484.1 hypothetical protein OG946_20230 [Streptomyces sp. NBC_01808]
MNTSDQPTPAARDLAEQLIAEVARHERDQAARRAAAGDPNPYDLAPYADVHDLARAYEDTRDDPAAREQFLDNLADDLDLADIRALRTAGDAAVAATPRVILAAAARGKKPPRIADEIGLTPARVYGIIRDAKQQATTDDPAAE